MKIMSDLAKKPVAEEQSKETESRANSPMRSPVRPQGKPRRGKSTIKSRSLSIEDEFMELIDVMTNADRWERSTRSDIIRAAIIHLASVEESKLAETIKTLKATSSVEASQRAEILRRKLD
ncbi:TPA: hypothetical protein ACJI3N_005205 [Raoultella planticola]